MKVSIVGAKQETRYPCVKVTDNGILVLFTAPKTGVILLSGGGSGQPGSYHTYWDEPKFRDFDGVITVSN